MKVTKREIIASVFIVSLLLTLGMFISGKIQNSVDTKNEALTLAVQISTPGEFSRAMRTNLGRTLSYGTLEGVDLVSVPELNGSYLYIKKVREKYTMHTETYTVTDSNGNTQVRTRTYWSWDHAGFEDAASSRLTFLGQTFATDKFELNNTHTLSLDDELLADECPYRRRGNYLYRGSDIRYYYQVVPTAFAGTVDAVLQDGAISGHASVSPNMTPEEVVERAMKWANVPIIIFWTVWLGATIGAVVLFVYFDNRWLE